MKIPGMMRRLRKSAGGNSAVEFGLIVPVLLTIVITIADVANIAVGTGEMQTAVRSAVQYLMNGGTNISTAQSQGVQAWNNEPAGGSLTASQACYCSGSSHSCQTLCSDNSSPQMYFTVTATAPLGGTIVNQTQTVSEKVRVK